MTIATCLTLSRLILSPLLLLTYVYHSKLGISNESLPWALLGLLALSELSDAFDGYAEAIGSGGTGPYTYVWSNGVTNSEIDNIGVGAYQVTVTDANGCSATASVSTAISWH